MQDCQYASCYYYDFCIYLNIRFISVEMTGLCLCLKTEFCVALALFDYFICIYFIIYLFIFIHKSILICKACNRVQTYTQTTCIGK